MFEITFGEDWSYYYEKVPREMNLRILKKMLELKKDKTFRHLRFGSPYFTLEVGQYRICFIEEESKRILEFVGNHKEYKKWIKMK